MCPPIDGKPGQPASAGLRPRDCAVNATSQSATLVRHSLERALAVSYPTGPRWATAEYAEKPLTNGIRTPENVEYKHRGMTYSPLS